MIRNFPILRCTPDDRKFRVHLAMTLLGIGVPMGLQFSITAIGSIMLQSANNALGTACVADLFLIPAYMYVYGCLKKELIIRKQPA